MLRDGRRGVVLEVLAGRVVTHEENGLAGVALGEGYLEVRGDFYGFNHEILAPHSYGWLYEHL
jgi:hypothetical protein